MGNNLSEHIEIMVVDDAPANLKLLSHLLIQAGYVVRPSDNGELALRSIQTRMPSLILLDVRMPDMDGYEVCRRLKADINTCHIPVIFISALGEEHSKVKGFEVGGVDYISKPLQKEEVLARVKTHINLRKIQLELELQKDRLVEEIEERKLAEEKLKESEERFRTTLYCIGDGVITTDSHGNVRLLNQVAENLTGWKQEEAQGKVLEEVFNIINEYSRKPVEIPIRRVLSEGIVVGLANHNLLIAKDGTEHPIADSGALIRNGNGEIVGVVLVFRDQSEERRAEQALVETEKRFRLLYENAPLSYQSLNPQAKLIDVNPVWLRTMGYSGKDEVLGRHFGEFMTKESAELIKNRFADFVASGEIHNYEFDMVRKDGTIITVSYEGKIGYDELGNFKQTHCIFTDITEQKKAELALKESEERFRNIFEHSPIGISITKVDGTLQVNQPFCDMLGYSEAELANKHWTEISHKDDEQLTRDVVAGLVGGKRKKTTFEKRYIHKNGSIVWTDVSTFLQRDLKGNPEYFITSISNITERKEAEVAIHQSEYFFRESQNAASIGSYIHDLTTGLWTSSEVLDQIFGIDKEYIRSVDGWQDLIFPGDMEMMDHHFKVEVIAEQKPFNKEYRIIRKSDGAVRWVHGLGQLISDDQGNLQSMIGTIQDITERKKAEIELSVTLQKLKFHIENTPLAVVEFNSKYEVASWSDHAEKLFGWKAEDVLGKDINSLKWVHEDDSERIARLSAEMAAGKENSNLHTNRNYTKDGKIIICEWYNSAFYDTDGHLISVQSLVLDISQRIEAEDKVHKSEKRFRALIENNSDGILLVDSDGLEIYHSPSCQRILGYSHEERNGKNFMGFVHPDYHETLTDLFVQTLKNPETIILPPTRVIHSDGSWRWIEGIANNLLAEPEVGAIVINFRDITQRKQMEDQLRLSERQYRTLFEQASDGIFIADQQGNYLDVNSYGCDMLCYSRDELLKLNIKDIIGKEEEAMDPIRYKELRENPVVTAERKLKRKDGSLMPVEISGKMLDDGRFQGIVRDITERKRAEETILEANQKMDAFFNQSLDGFFFMMLDEPIDWNELADKDSLLDYAFTHQRITKINQAMLNQYCAQSSDFQKLTPTDLFAHDIEQGKSEWRKLFDFGKLHTETDERKLNGEQIFIEGDYICLYDAEGRITGHFGIQRDITRAKKAIADLEDSEKKFRTLIESSNDGISLLDLQGNILFANTRKAEMIGVASCHELIGKNASTMLTPEYQLKFSGLTAEFLSKGYLRNIEAEVIRTDGSTFWGDFNLSLVADSSGKPSYIMDSMRDVSEQKRSIAVIESERKLLRTLIDNLPDSIFIKDTNCRKIAANNADIERMNMTCEAEAIGKTDFEIFVGEIGMNGYSDDLAVIETGNPILNKEQSFDDKHGGIRWSLVSKFPLFDQTGKIYGLVGIGRDITAQKKANETIQKLTESIEQSPSTIVITDVFGTIEYVNPTFTDITGYTKEEAIGQNPRILKSGEMPVEIYKQLWETISMGNVWRGELLNRKKYGELYWEWSTITSIKDEQGKITNYIAIKEDISLRKQIEADLIVAKEKAEESDRLKSAFLANMSHEIRTPLNSIIGFSELLTDSAYEVDQKNEFIQHIINNGNNLLKIISDIMDISKIESGELKIYKSKISVQKFISKVSSQFAIQFEGKSVEFIVDLPVPDYEVVIFADEDRLMQVFNNLISNALKFTSKGSIQIGYQPNSEMVEFHVKDTGIGIPTEYHDKIFERFRQVEGADKRKYGGNGLGLAITRNLIHLMGGEIWIESKVGKGAIFYFTLPISN